MLKKKKFINIPAFNEQFLKIIMKKKIKWILLSDLIPESRSMPLSI